MRIWLLSLLFVSFVAQAIDLNPFNNLNISEPTAIQNQEAGILSGGSIIARNSVKNINPMHITTPHVGAGCGGIDIVSGGISFIKLEKLKETMQSILNDLPGVAFKIGLDTLTPMMGNVVSEFSSLAQKFNQFQINSCQVATQLADSVAGKMKEAYYSNCVDTALSSGNASSRVEAMRYCQNSGNAEKDKDRENKKKNLKDFSGNVAWKTIKDTTAGADLKRIMLSLSGTIIIPNSPEEESKIYPPLAQKIEFLEKLLNGGSVGLYKCVDDNCLRMVEESTTIEGLVPYVRTAIYNMLDSIKKDEELKEDSKQIIGADSSPILSLAETSFTADGRAATAFMLNNYKEFLAFRILARYLDELSTRISTDIGKDIYLPKDVKTQMKENLASVRKLLASEYKKMRVNFNMAQDAAQLIRFKEERMRMATAQLLKQMGGI